MAVSANLGKDLLRLEPGAFLTDRTEIVEGVDGAKELIARRRNSIRQVAVRNNVKVEVEGLHQPYYAGGPNAHIVTVVVRRVAY